MALLLRERGYKAWALNGGFQAWAGAGYPLQPKKAEIETSLLDICPQCKASLKDHR